MRINTKVFELQRELGWSDRKLAAEMGISDAQVSRVRSGQRDINHDFMTGALRAFPGKELCDLFFSVEEPDAVAS
jgi:transcriptional regulator with XRE-family HTH domain